MPCAVPEITSLQATPFGLFRKEREARNPNLSKLSHSRKVPFIQAESNRIKSEVIMKTCKRVNNHGAAGTVLNTAQRIYGHRRRGKLSTDAVLAQASGRASLRVPNANSLASQNQAALETPAANPPQSPGPFKTKSGLDITQRVTELLWLNCERGYLTREMVHQAHSGDDATAEQLSAVRLALAQAGVHLVDATAVDPVRSAAHTASEELGHRKTQYASVENGARQTDEPHSLPRDEEPVLIRQMAEAERMMRRILYSFGFTAHEHIARAEKLLAHPSTESFEHLVADSQIRSRIQYLKTLPKLVKQVREVDQKTAAAYKKRRQTLGQLKGEIHRTEFRKFDSRLQQILPGFCYQTEVIQEMMAIAQNIAAKFEASLRVLQQAERCRDSVSQLPLVDVERQAIERMEESVRMPGEVFLRNCRELMAAGTRFREARCELIHSHLHLVASLAPTYSNRGLTLPELIREGIFGLIRAVEKFERRREWKFSTYAACLIRQRILGALAARPRTGERL